MPSPPQHLTVAKSRLRNILVIQYLSMRLGYKKLTTTTTTTKTISFCSTQEAASSAGWSGQTMFYVEHERPSVTELSSFMNIWSMFVFCETAKTSMEKICTSFICVFKHLCSLAPYTATTACSSSIVRYLSSRTNLFLITRSFYWTSLAIHRL